MNIATRSKIRPGPRPQPHVLMADALARMVERSARVSVTWVNHSSLLSILDSGAGLLEGFDLVGVDGKLLQLLCRASGRTSADLVVPELLKRLPGPRIGIIGGHPDSVEGARQAIQGLLGSGGSTEIICDGFAGLLRGEELRSRVLEVAPTVVLVGLGAGLQERVVLEASNWLPSGALLTCGGFLDQVQQSNYYPKWAYPLRLNWLVRVWREPRRLYRRYTVQAVTAILKRRRLRVALRSAPGYGRMNHLVHSI